MKKPTSLLRKEFIEKMANQINESGLPFFVIEPILEYFLEYVHNEAERLYQLEKARYEASLTEQDESKEE